jgi:hypothetical protein
MRTRYLTMMGAAVLAASVFGSGCSRKPDASDTGSARIAAINLLAYSDIKKVDVTIASDSSGANPAAISKPILVPLGQKTNSNDWVSTVQGIPAGNVLYTGNAYDGTGAVIFTGNIKGVVTASQTANVLINLFQTTANQFSNNAPVIDALQVATTAATPGQAVDVNVVAHDPDTADTLIYAWTSTCGAVSPANVARSTWTAPASASAACVLTVTVTDNHGAQTSATASISVAVSNKGGAAITVAPDLAPIISAINVNVVDATDTAAAFVKNNIAKLQAVATDDGTSMTYAWTVAGCTGSFSDASLASTGFTLSDVAPAVCTFTVVVTDDKGQPTSGSLVLPVAPTEGSSKAAPIVETYSNSSDTVSPGQTIYFYVSVSQIAHDGIDFVWTAVPTGGTGSGMTHSEDPNFATPSSTATYVAPSDLGDLGQPLVVTVTATDSANKLTVSHTWSLTKKTAQCAAGSTGTCDDGNACTTGDHCDGQGNCVPGAAKDCTANLPVCKAAGTCDKSSGACVYPDAASGTSCNDTLACTTNDICNGHGSCNGTPVVCPAAECQTPGTCQEPTGACSASTPVTGGTCSDGKGCTTGDTCNNGVCVGTQVTCPAATDACHVAGTCQESTGSCSAQTIGNEGGACDDSNACTTGDKCQNGVCSGSALCVAPLVCNPATASCVAPACMQPTAAKDWPVLTVSTAFDGGATPSVYTAGITYVSYDFGAGAKAEGGDSDVYVNKVNPATGVASWTMDFGDSSSQEGHGVAASADKVGVIGNYLGTMAGAASFLPANSGAAAVDFVLGLNPATGAPVWGKKIDLNGGVLNAISSNPSINAFFVCGVYGSTSTAAGSAGPSDLILTSTPTSAGVKDLVVAKINAADGTIAWAKMFGSNGNDTCTSVTSSDDGSVVYITGTYAGPNSSTAATLSFGTSPALPASAKNTQAHIYVAKLDGATGTPIAAVGYGTTGVHTPTSIVTDFQGNVLVAGGFVTTINFATGISIATTGGTDAFVVELNASLVPQWAKHFGATGGTAGIRGLATDSTGRIFATGLFDTGLNIGAAGAVVASNGATDAFTVKMDSQGNLVCGASYGDDAGQAGDAISIARFATGTGKDLAMFAGDYAGSIDFGAGIKITNADPSASHGFVAAISENSY